MSSNLDIYKYISELVTGTVSMGACDYLIYGAGTSQAMYSGFLFGISLTGVTYVSDYLLHIN